MAYPVYIGSLDKRVNSTKRPSLAEYQAWDYYEVTLKEEGSIDDLTLLLRAEFAEIAPKHYNYAIMFGRWYWVTDVRFIRTNQIEVDLKVDVLALNHTNIKGTKAFIEYGLNEFDASVAAYRIADSRRPVSKNPITAKASASFSGGKFSQYGTYILQAVSNDDGVSCFAISGGVLRNIMGNVAQDIENVLDGIEADLNPQDYAGSMAAVGKAVIYNYKQSLLAESGIKAIKSVHWLPLHYTEPVGSNENIWLGDYNTRQIGKLLTQNANWINTGSITIPWQASDWRRCNSQISLYIPFFGTVPVPVDQCINNSSIDYTVSLDLLSGDLSIRVTCGDQTIYTGSTNVAAPYAIGFSTVSASSNLSGAIQMTGGAIQCATGAIDAGASIIGMFTGGGSGFSQAATTMLAGAQNYQSGYAQTIQPLITSAGSMGGLAALGQEQDIIMTVLYYPPINDTDFEGLYGHPVFKVDYPVNGFCKTRGFSLSISSDLAYAATVNAAMDGGVFIED